MVGTAEVINTVWVGMIYLVLALPLTLSYRTTGILNFVHINFITIGAYVGALMPLLGIKNVFLIVPIAFVLGGAIAVFDHFAVFSRLIRKGANVVILMISSLGLWIFYKYLIYGILDSLQKSMRTNLFSIIPRVESLPTIELEGLRISGNLLATAVIAAIVSLGLYLVLTRTATGKAIRAVADNPTLAEISGIPKERVIYVTWLISGGLAVIGGMLWGIFAIATPEVGDTLILQIFAVSVIGGLSNLLLTAMGAFIIAGAENILMSGLNAAFGIPVSFRPFISFSVLLTVILVKPPLGAGGGLPYRFKLPFKSRRWGLR
jgi:branched-chain amino acid transport system permease protein